ncbi:hypothetical protein B0H17DRAFT_1124811 [Mycena rosella]|uniref:Uncharacterized protein n=1 Tax=Mycena rosella TaxID=1033263 RepID=A0AAD7H0S7_MYCRO|nr:hypothetical protein B0H17DRAFT_1124811 [Mycena rosella]
MNSLTCTRKCGALLTYVMGISETMTCDQFMRRRERGRDERSSCRRSDNAEYLPNIAGEIEAEISSKSATLKGSTTVFEHCEEWQGGKVFSIGTGFPNSDRS